MPHLRIVGRQQEACANARKPNESAPDNMETRWCESLVDVGPSGGPVAKKNVRLASSNMDCASLEQWCEWFRAHQAQMLERGAGTMSLDVVDFSCKLQDWRPRALRPRGLAAGAAAQGLETLQQPGLRRGSDREVALQRLPARAPHFKQQDTDPYGNSPCDCRHTRRG